MKLEQGRLYGDYTYEGFIKSSNYRCDVCRQDRWALHWFIKTGSNPNESDYLKIGSECIKKDNFWTRLLGIN